MTFNFTRKNPLASEEDRELFRQLYGPFNPKPFPDPLFNTLVKIYSTLPHQHDNPLAQYAHLPQYQNVPFWPKWSDFKIDDSDGQKSDDVYGSSALRREQDAPHVVYPSSVENDTFLMEGNCSRTDDAYGLSKVRKDDLSRSSDGKAMEENASEEGANNVKTNDAVTEDLSYSDRMLLNKSDDLGILEPSDKDLCLNITNSLYSDINMSDIPNLPGKSCDREEPAAGRFTEDDVINHRKGKELEVQKTVSEVGTEIPLAQQFLGEGMSSCQDPGNQKFIIGPVDALNKRRKHKTSHQQSSRGSHKNVGDDSIGKNLDNFGKSTQVNFVAEGNKNTDKEGNKAFEVEFESGKHQPLCIENGASIRKKPWSDSPMVLGNMLKENQTGISKSSLTRKDERSWSYCRARSRYSREQLLDFRKMASISDDMMKTVTEIGAQVYVKDQAPTASKLTNTSGLNMEQTHLTEDKKPEENVSGILKTKKRGSSSEARKEKKKLRRRKKRAETNRKLGVKRLTLKPVMKPKVVQHCRHYLKGRCQEGEKCKFSHDVIPLTKSKPCCHFARQTCMKGEDCPFDHQLSKYPCNNIVETGFCGRGDRCLFSHKISAVQGGKAGETNVQPSVVVGKASGDAPASSTHQAVNCRSLERTSGVSSGHSKQLNSPAHKENSLRSGRNGGTLESGTQLHHGLSSGAAEMYKSFQTPPITKGITLFSSVEKPESASGKLKEIQQELSGQLTTKVDLPIMKVPSNSQRALESVFAFAAKHASSVKSSTATVSKQIDNINTTAESGSTSKSRGESSVSAILQFLYQNSDKEKQPRSSNA